MWTDADAIRLAAGAEELSVALSVGQVGQFGRLAETLEEANRSLNLTRIPVGEFVELHFLDSLAIGLLGPLEDDVLDVGTGAGFPGLALAIAWPESKFTLVDATLKKLRFVERVARELRLTNVKVVHGRAEELAREREFAGRFGLVTARAVAPLERLIGWTAPFVRGGGRVVAYKSSDVEAELAAAEVRRFRIPGTAIERSLVSLRKRSPGGAGGYVL
jgi:16S rRNA (guanine527-N7)-methyltransferase